MGTDGDSRELDARYSDGVEVRLMWNQATDRLWVAVRDLHARAAFALEVQARDAIEAFRHPYAYAAANRLAPQALTRV